MCQTTNQYHLSLSAYVTNLKKGRVGVMNSWWSSCHQRDSIAILDSLSCQLPQMLQWHPADKYTKMYYHPPIHYWTHTELPYLPSTPRSCKGRVERRVVRVHRRPGTPEAHAELRHPDVGHVPLHVGRTQHRGTFHHVPATAQDAGIEDVWGGWSRRL